MRLAARLMNVSELTAGLREEMFALMDRHYANVHRQIFEADLAKKSWVILVRDPASRRLCGFSTQMLLDLGVEGRHLRALFSGDTIISREHWGDPALAHIWGRFALSLIDRCAETELYWFLISQGYRTYRFLPVFFREFYPRHDTATPPWARVIVDAAARACGLADYDPASGIVRANSWQYRLREGLAEMTPGRLRDPHVQFFQTRNPGHASGDELCCLAPLTRANFTRAAYRVIGAEQSALAVSP